MFHVYCFMLIVSLTICGRSCSIINPPHSCLSDDLQLHKIRCCGPCLYTVTYYKRKYLSRRILYASNGSFNPYIITNKEAHLVNGNPALSKDSNSRKSSQTKPHLQERFGKEISQSLPRSCIPPRWANAFQELLPWFSRKILMCNWLFHGVKLLHF